jgi:hypothetical protein
MEQAQRAIGPDEPVRVAWIKHKASDEYANALRWAGQSNEGQLWACFVAGYVAGGGHTSAEVASIAGDLLNLTVDDLLALDPEALQTHVDRVQRIAASCLGQRQ